MKMLTKHEIWRIQRMNEYGISCQEMAREIIETRNFNVIHEIAKEIEAYITEQDQ